MRTFLLLDIDGVLLETNGYRAAYVDAANHFLEVMGQPHLRVDRHTAETFEAAGFAAEWDMIPLTIAFFLSFYLENGIAPFEDSVSLPANLPPLGTKEAFRSYVSKKINAIRSLQDLSQVRAHISEVLPAFAEKPLLTGLLLEGNLDPGHAPWFCYLECLLLGSDRYTETFGLQPPLICSSYLVEKDRRLLSDAWQKRLKTEWLPVVMTYRPSLVPQELGNFSSKYAVNTPEAECAMSCLGWEDGAVPLIGCGTLTYMEETAGRPLGYYCKPHPVHALVSVLYAACGDLAKAVKCAELTEKEQADLPGDILPKSEPIRIAVFEDSASGIRSAESCADILRSFGYRVELLKYGILSFEEKRSQLKGVADHLCMNINDALDDMEERIGREL